MHRRPPPSPAIPATDPGAATVSSARFRPGFVSRTCQLAAWLTLLGLLLLGALGVARADDTAAWARTVQRSGDAAGQPFAVVDKRHAVMAVYRADGTLAGRTPVLLGAAPGDHSLPGVGLRTQRGTLRPEDRTTPAGRFESRPGRNLEGEAIVWVDYEAAFAIHRLRDDATRALRERRLQRPEAAARRVSAGCVVVPVAFYREVVQPLLGRRHGVVYVLPERADSRVALLRDGAGPLAGQLAGSDTF